MSRIKVNMTLDLGNSQNRMIVQWMDDGDRQRELLELPNRYAGVAPGYAVPEDYDSDTSFLFEMDEAMYCAGALAEREFSNGVIRPTANKAKYLSHTTKLSVTMCIIETFRVLKTHDMGLDEVDLSVTLLLPPADVDAGTSVLDETVKSITSVNSYYPEIRDQAVNVTQVAIRAEGTSAFQGTIFGLNRKTRKEMAMLKDATVLCVDTGAGTTDYVIHKERRAIDSTKHTENIGGNNVHQNLRAQLRRSNLTVSETAAIEAVVTGQVKSGNRAVDVTNELSIARKTVADQLANSVTTFLEASAFQMTDVEYVMFTGGGSIPTSLEGQKSLADYVYENLKELSPNLDMVKPPFEFATVERRGLNAEESVDVPSERWLNVIGAGIYSQSFI